MTSKGAPTLPSPFSPCNFRRLNPSRHTSVSQDSFFGALRRSPRSRRFALLRTLSTLTLPIPPVRSCVTFIFLGLISSSPPLPCLRALLTAVISTRRLEPDYSLPAFLDTFSKYPRSRPYVGKHNPRSRARPTPRTRVNRTLQSCLFFRRHSQRPRQR